MRVFIYVLFICCCLFGLMTSVAETAWCRNVRIKWIENCVEGSGPDITGGVVGLHGIYWEKSRNPCQNILCLKPGILKNEGRLLITLLRLFLLVMLQTLYSLLLMILEPP